MGEPTMSTAAQRVFCEVTDCTKHYKSRANMLQHVRTHHKSGVMTHNCSMMKEVTERQTNELEIARQDSEKTKGDTKNKTDKMKK